MADGPWTRERITRSVAFAESTHQLLCRIPLIEAANKNLPAHQRIQVPVALEAYDASMFYDMVVAPLMEIERLLANEKVFIEWIKHLLDGIDLLRKTAGPATKEKYVELFNNLSHIETYYRQLTELSEVARDQPGV